jgi:glycosyltransferase involved in cell wall biosynthesis
MKIAIAKPDFHAAGGFEGVVGRLAAGLRGRGHQVDLVQVDADVSPTSDLGVSVDALHVSLFRDFFFHLNMVARFEQIDVSSYDVVLCTQPASWAVRHPKKVVLFYHHTRTFYDLFEAIESVRGHDVALHHLAAFVVRDVDGFFLTSETPILAGSRRVKQRLADHNGLGASVEVFSAGIDEGFFEYSGPIAFESPLCVGRHEFPKRTELFLHAMLHVADLEGRVLGAGSFTERLTALDGWLRLQHGAPPAGAAPSRSGCHVDDDRLWRDVAIHAPLDRLRAGEADAVARGMGPRVRFLGRGSKDDLVREYASALCVVCPAFDEDYGLTCLEAMAFGKPVIACVDGGGYVELIDDGVDGFLVEATGPAIARAIDRLRDPDLARTMGARGREKANAYTWERAIDHVERTLEERLKATPSRNPASRT